MPLYLPHTVQRERDRNHKKHSSWSSGSFKNVFFIVVDCCFLQLLTVRLRTADTTRKVALTIEPTENQEIPNLDFTSETAGIFQRRKRDGDYPGKAYTVGRKLSLGWSYVEWNEKNSSFRGGKWDRREHT